MREIEFTISNKSLVAIKVSLVAAVLIGLVVFTVFNMLPKPVHAEDECIEEASAIGIECTGGVCDCNSCCINLGYTSGLCAPKSSACPSGTEVSQCNVWCGTCHKCCCSGPSTTTTTSTISTTSTLITTTVGECTPGETRPCPNPDQGCEGTQTCEQNGFWGPCDSQGKECSRTTYCDDASQCDGHAMYAVCDGNAKCGQETNRDDTDDSGCVGQVCKSCLPGPDCILAGPSYTIDIWKSGAWYCDSEGDCNNECIYDQYCLDNDYWDGSLTVGCGAVCDGYGYECPDYCEGDIKYEGYCDLWPGDCTCDYDEYDCNDLNGWYDTGNTRWVESDQCKDKEQKEQEYRDYTCNEEPKVDCYYTVTGYRWIDTGAINPKPKSTPCDDGLWCSLEDHCDGQGNCVQLTPRDCSDEDECTEDTCDEENDRCLHTHLDVNSPVTTKTYGQPTFPEVGYPKWITSQTPITLTAIDYGIDQTQVCAKGVDKTFYRYCLSPGCYYGGNGGIIIDVILPACECPEGTPWLEYTEPFTIPEDSEHCIEYYSQDKAINGEIIDGANIEPVKSQCVYVDTKPPETVKVVEEPKAKWDGKDSYFYPGIGDLCWNGQENEIECWKVTKETEITMSCDDSEPHPVGVKKLCYSISLDAKDATKTYCDEFGGKMEEDLCCVYNGEISYEFHFLEDSEHELEFYCVDELDNKSPIDIEKFKVFGGKFKIHLNEKWNLISVPFVLFDDDPKEVFKDIKNDVLLVLTYDAEDTDCVANNGWCIYIPSTGVGTIKHIKPGWGYWVLTKKDTLLTVVGSLLHEGVTPPSRSLVKGWNLIGYYGTDGLTEYNGPVGNGRQAFCALHSLVNLYNPIPTEWDALITYWKGTWPELDACDRMDPGAGYWIGMNVADSDYRYTTDCSGNPCY